MFKSRKKLQLTAETLRHLNGTSLDFIYGGDRTERTDHRANPIGGSKLFCKPQPQPQPPPPIQSWASCGSCVGFQCPAGTNKTVIMCNFV